MAQLKANVTVQFEDGGKIVLPKDAICRDDLYNILIFNGYTVRISADEETKKVTLIFWRG